MIAPPTLLPTACDVSEWAPGSTNTVHIGDPAEPNGPGGLRDLVTGAFVNDATCLFVGLRKKATGADVVGVPLPKVMTYLPGSNGVYYALADSTAEVNKGEVIEAEMTAETVPGRIRTFFAESVVA